MKNINERKCLACGEIHNGETCPLIENKLSKYYKSPKKNFLIGNILLECIKKNIDFYQILCEIVEMNENIHEKNQYFETILSLGSIEYFAISLNCRISNLSSPKARQKNIVN